MLDVFSSLPLAVHHPLPALYVILAIIHVIYTCTFLGALIYSVFVMIPGTQRYFGEDVDALNDFQMVVAHGGRTKVIQQLGPLLASGLGMLAVDHRLDLTQALLVIGKTVAFAVVVGAFWYMTFNLWPRRPFALASEMPGIMNRFKVAMALTFAAIFGALAMGVILVQT